MEKSLVLALIILASAFLASTFETSESSPSAMAGTFVDIDGAYVSIASTPLEKKCLNGKLDIGEICDPTVSTFCSTCPSGSGTCNNNCQCVDNCVVPKKVKQEPCLCPFLTQDPETKSFALDVKRAGRICTILGGTFEILEFTDCPLLAPACVQRECSVRGMCYWDDDGQEIIDTESCEVGYRDV